MTVLQNNVAELLDTLSWSTIAQNVRDEEITPREALEGVLRMRRLMSAKETALVERALLAVKHFETGTLVS